MRYLALPMQRNFRKPIANGLNRHLLETSSERSVVEAIAVGSLAFIENVRSELGSKALHRDIEHIDGAYTLREQSEVYDGNLIGDTEPLRLENAFLWDENAATI